MTLGCNRPEGCKVDTLEDIKYEVPVEKLRAHKCPWLKDLGCMMSECLEKGKMIFSSSECRRCSRIKYPRHKLERAVFWQRTQDCECPERFNSWSRISFCRSLLCHWNIDCFCHPDWQVALDFSGLIVSTGPPMYAGKENQSAPSLMAISH